MCMKYFLSVPWQLIFWGSPSRLLNPPVFPSLFSFMLPFLYWKALLSLFTIKCKCNKAQFFHEAFWSRSPSFQGVLTWGSPVVQPGCCPKHQFLSIPAEPASQCSDFSENWPRRIDPGVCSVISGLSYKGGGSLSVGQQFDVPSLMFPACATWLCTCVTCISIKGSTAPLHRACFQHCANIIASAFLGFLGWCFLM